MSAFRTPCFCTCRAYACKETGAGPEYWLPAISSNARARPFVVIAICGTFPFIPVTSHNCSKRNLYTNSFTIPKLRQIRAESSVSESGAFWYRILSARSYSNEGPTPDIPDGSRQRCFEQRRFCRQHVGHNLQSRDRFILFRSFPRSAVQSYVRCITLVFLSPPGRVLIQQLATELMWWALRISYYHPSTLLNLRYIGGV